MTATIAKKKPFAWDSWEREAWRPPPEESIDSWLEKHIVLPSAVSSNPGPLDLDVTPYLREILRAYVDPLTEEITMCTSTQVAKTTTGLLCVMYSMVEDPWNCLVVMPREEDAVDLNVDRYQALILESPTLSEHLKRFAGDMTAKKISTSQMAIWFAGAQSPAGLSMRSVRTLILDEVDKWPPWSGREADPIELARERTRTFRNRKIIKKSTPTTDRGFIWRELAASTHERYHVPCPRCEVYQELVWGGKTGPGVKWPEGRKPDEIRDQRLAWYECRNCGGRIEDQQKAQMLKRGRWVPAGCKLDSRGQLIDRQPPRRHRGFHLWAGYSPWLTFSEIAAKFLETKDSPPLLMNFVNSWLGETWKVTVHEVKGAMIRSRKLPYVQGEVPDGGWCLTAGVDVQSTGEHTQLYYVLRAWGKEGESWLVKCGFAEGWEVLHQVFFKSAFRDSEGGRVPLHMLMVDSGYRTSEVYEFCMTTGAWATKGASNPQKRVYQASRIPHGGTRIQLAVFDTGHLKEKLHRLIHDGEKWHVPVDVPEEYVDHMVAEQRVSIRDRRTGRERLMWKVIPEGAPNHYFDCEVLCALGAEVLDGYQLAEKPKAPEQPASDQSMPQAAQTGVHRMRENTFSRGI